MKLRCLGPIWADLAVLRPANVSDEPTTNPDLSADTTDMATSHYSSVIMIVITMQLLLP